MDNALPSQKDGLLKAGEVNVGRTPVRVPQATFEPPSPKAPPPATGDQPAVSYVADDDGVVRTIVVRCACGREISLQCEYPDGGTP